ncbi:MAG TPA: ABC transporter permease [Treponemataceae bacterium]|nr:ABC transporter permease [Treponemataceae bacterium]
MFLHLFLYRLKSFFRTRSIIFWTMLFPILLSTLFKFAFGSSSDILENYKTIPVGAAVVSENAESERFLSILKSAEFSKDNPMFSIKAGDLESSKKLLVDGQIDGIIILDSSFSVLFSKSNINQSIIRQFVNRYIQTVKIVTDIASVSPENFSKTLSLLEENPVYLQSVTVGGEKSDPMLQYFYALIAMACLYGSFLGLQNSHSIQANLSALGARRHVTPTSRKLLIIADTLAAYLIHFLSIIVLYLYIRFVLQMPVGPQPAPFLLICLLGSVIGVSIGQCVGSLARKSENLKMALTLGFSMLSSIFSGLMYADIKYYIGKNAPIINKINPATLISDAFYSLSVYSDYERFSSSLITLALMSAALIIISYFSIKRGKYASI